MSDLVGKKIVMVHLVLIVQVDQLVIEALQQLGNVIQEDQLGGHGIEFWVVNLK